MGVRSDSPASAASLTGNGPLAARYIVLLNGTEEDQGFSADEVRGIYTVSQGRQKDIPGEAIGTDNSCLLKAAYVEELASWAFIVKPDIFLRQRGIE